MKYVFSTTLALTLLASAPALAQGKIDVMTQNQYLGADLTPIITAETEDEFKAAFLMALQQIADNNIEARSKQLAELIADRLPELVGLQEMFDFRCVPEEVCAAFLPDAFKDHLGLTRDELKKLGEDYDIGGIVPNLDITLSVDLDGDETDDVEITVLDRDVILVRHDVPWAPVPFSAICGNFGLPGVAAAEGTGCNYSAIAELPDTPIGLIKVQRGFVGVDALIDDGVYRFVDTHLEVENLVPAPQGPFPPGQGACQSPADWVWGGSVQAAQSTELNVLVAASLALLPSDFDAAASPIIVGDINSGPTDDVFCDPLFPNPGMPTIPPTQELIPPYMQLTTGQWLYGGQPSPPTPFLPAPLTDAWDLRPGAVPGYSCCQTDDLSNHHSELDERIDVIFSLAVPYKVKKARVLGAKESDKTPPPGQRLWPSDHGSVAAELEF